MMPEAHELIALVELAREEERRLARVLTLEQRAVIGTLDAPSSRDLLAHVSGAKESLCDALAGARAGRPVRATHSREALFAANATRPLEQIEDGAERVTCALAAEIELLDPDALAAAPEWIEEETVADEIVQQAVTHSLAHILEPLTRMGHGDAAIAAQERFLGSMPAECSALQRSRTRYNLACLYATAGRDDDAIRELEGAARERPELLEHARTDADLAHLRDRIVSAGGSFRACPEPAASADS
jgi:tetratricopeptide (TPR) repeat protein